MDDNIPDNDIETTTDDDAAVEAADAAADAQAEAAQEPEEATETAAEPEPDATPAAPEAPAAEAHAGVWELELINPRTRQPEVHQVPGATEEEARANIRAGFQEVGGTIRRVV